MSQDQGEGTRGKGHATLGDLLEPETQENLKDWTREARQWVETHPWAAALGALALGYVLGSMTSRRERDSR